MKAVKDIVLKNAIPFLVGGVITLIVVSLGAPCGKGKFAQFEATFAKQEEALSANKDVINKQRVDITRLREAVNGLQTKIADLQTAVNAVPARLENVEKLVLDVKTATAPKATTKKTTSKK